MYLVGLTDPALVRLDVDTKLSDQLKVNVLSYPVRLNKMLRGSNVVSWSIPVYQYFLSEIPTKEMGPYKERKKKLWRRWDSTLRPPEQMTVAQPLTTELQGQMGTGRGKLRW